MALFRLHRHYTTPLPPGVMARRLGLVIKPAPTGWRRWLSWVRPPCQGVVDTETSTFRARVAHGRSNGPVVAGRWHPAPGSGSLVELTISLTAEGWFGVFFGLAVFGSLAAFLLARPVALLNPAGLLLLMPLLILADLRWSLRRAERYFTDALQLTRLPA